VIAENSKTDRTEKPYTKGATSQNQDDLEEAAHQFPAKEKTWVLRLEIFSSPVIPFLLLASTG
jgi:hypothetical protein